MEHSLFDQAWVVGMVLISSLVLLYFRSLKQNEEIQRARNNVTKARGGAPKRIDKQFTGPLATDPDMKK